MKNRKTEAAALNILRLVNHFSINNNYRWNESKYSAFVYLLNDNLEGECLSYED